MLLPILGRGGSPTYDWWISYWVNEWVDNSENDGNKWVSEWLSQSVSESDFMASVFAFRPKDIRPMVEFLCKLLDKCYDRMKHPDLWVCSVVCFWLPSGDVNNNNITNKIITIIIILKIVIIIALVVILRVVVVFVVVICVFFKLMTLVLAQRLWIVDIQTDNKHKWNHILSKHYYPSCELIFCHR